MVEDTSSNLKYPCGETAKLLHHCSFDSCFWRQFPGVTSHRWNGAQDHPCGRQKITPSWSLRDSNSKKTGRGVAKGARRAASSCCLGCYCWEVGTQYYLTPPECSVEQGKPQAHIYFGGYLVWLVWGNSQTGSYVVRLNINVPKQGMLPS